MSIRRSFDRRAFFRGLGAASLIAGPLLRAQRAAAATPPRVILFFLGGGLQAGYWKQPLGHGDSLVSATLTKGLGCFEKPEYKALKSRLTVYDAMYFRYGPGVDVHQASGKCALAAAAPGKLAGKVSLDRVLAGEISAEMPFRSIRLKVASGIYDHSFPSLGGSSSLSTTFADPAGAFKGIFPGSSGVDSGPKLRADILSQSKRECEAVLAETERQLGRAAALRVQNQCDSLRDLERRARDLASTAQTCAGIQPPPAGITALKYNDGPGYANLTAHMDYHFALAVNALACNRTRVVLYEMYGDQPENACDFLGPVGQKAYVHSKIWHRFDADAAPVKQAYTSYYLERFAQLARRADDLGILDDTIILWTTGDPDGSHGWGGSAPCLYLGGGGGRFVTGKYLKPTGGVGINDVYTSVLRGATGKDFPLFGDDNSGRARYDAAPDILKRV